LQQLKKENLGEEHPSVANSYINIGWALKLNGTERNGRLEEAISIYNIKTLGEEHRSVATSNMDLVGARQEARIIHELFDQGDCHLGWRKEWQRCRDFRSKTSIAKLVLKFERLMPLLYRDSSG
jgi:hypothetical protein